MCGEREKGLWLQVIVRGLCSDEGERQRRSVDVGRVGVEHMFEEVAHVRLQVRIVVHLSIL